MTFFSRRPDGSRVANRNRKETKSRSRATRGVRVLDLVSAVTGPTHASLLSMPKSLSSSKEETPKTPAFLAIGATMLPTRCDLFFSP
jgi:hypothetical protein